MAHHIEPVLHACRIDLYGYANIEVRPACLQTERGCGGRSTRGRTGRRGRLGGCGIMLTESCSDTQDDRRGMSLKQSRRRLSSVPSRR